MVWLPVKYKPMGFTFLSGAGRERIAGLLQKLINGGQVQKVVKAGRSPKGKAGLYFEKKTLKNKFGF